MLKKYKPTSPGVRFRKTLVRELTANKPEKSLLQPLKGASGRSNGLITTRHRQRGHKRQYRVVDFKREKLNIPAKVASIEYDPNRGPSIALLHYVDGAKRYILAPEGLQVGSMVVSGADVEIAPGNCLPLEKIPAGVAIHNIELNPGQGASLVRGAGNSAIIMAKDGNFVNVKLPSGEVKKIRKGCMATIGALGNADLRNTQDGKAGIKRHKGWRPSVRGITMDPASHPMGGSYKDNGIGMPYPKSPWGWNTRGKKTRKRFHTDIYVVTSRAKSRKKGK